MADRLRRTTRACRRSTALLVAGALVVLALPCRAVASCPADPSASADTVLTLRIGAQPPVRFDLRAVTALGERQLTQRRSVASGSGASAVATEQSVVYAGVPLGVLIGAAGGGPTERRDQRSWVFDAVATDGYRAVFSWGELFNSDAAEQILVITAQNGRPLDAREGPLALRALADRRPGPRHVRNLCAIIVRALPLADR
jgi:hypothetical protein